jgi:hypothetical protein
MVFILYPSIPQSSDAQHSTVILIGFDSERVKAILADETVTKLVIFDDNDNARAKFEKVYPIYRDRITLCEGAVESSLNGYFKAAPEIHRLEVLKNRFRPFHIV